MGDSTADAIQAAQSLELNGEDGKAAQIYSDILSDDPNNGEAQSALKSIEHRLQSSVQQMSTLIGAGLYNEAVFCASSAINANPTSPELLRLLGTALLGLEKFEEARDIFEVAYGLDPKDAQTLTNLGACSIKLGDSKSAISYFSRLILLDAKDADAHYKLGLALETDGKSEAAIGSFGKAIECNSNHIGALTRMSTICRKLGYDEHAIQAQSKAVDAKPEEASLWLSLGELYLVTDKPKEAIRILSHTLTLDEHLYKARCALGFAYQGDEQSEKATRCFSKCLDEMPDDPEAIKGMALASKKVGDLITAHKMFHRWVELTPNNPVALTNAGEFLYESSDLNKARELAKRALEFTPNNKAANMLLAVIEKSAGNFEIFAKHLRRTLEIAPNHAAAMRFLVDFVEEDELDSLIARMEAVAADSGEKLNQRTDALYGLAGLAKKRGAYAEVVERLDRISTLVREDHDIVHFERRRREIEAMRTAFATPIAPLDVADPHQPTPIFILGMPRSGTTMSEQILSNHSKVFGGGELSFARLASRRSNEALAAIEPEHLEAFRSIYLEQISALDHNGAAFVTDKMPMNFTYIGFLALALPEAKIIHLNRRPEAVCWSNFRAPFGAKGLEYSYHQEEIGKHYREYEDLMAFWKERFGDRIYDLQYEAVTEDPEAQMRPVLDWIGLPWEDGLVEIRKNKRAIRTASYKQVREEIYKGSSEEWQNYEPYIQPMLKALRGE